MVDLALTMAEELVKHYEQCRLTPYQNEGDRPTVGWGNTFYKDHKPVALDDPPLTQVEADDLFGFWLEDFMKKVRGHIPAAPPHELAAFTSFAYNVGITGYSHSSALRTYLHGDKPGVGSALELWNKAAGKVLKGLQRRRRAEHLVFNGQKVAVAVAQALKDYP